jgi:hypothetical protein
MVIDHQRSLLWFSQSATDAKRLGMLSISEALAANNKKQVDNQPSTAIEKASEAGIPKWLILLVVIIGVATLGSWLTRKLRLPKQP